MFIDSHCHLDRVDLSQYAGDFSALLEAIKAAGVSHMLCVSIDLESYPSMLGLVEGEPNIFVSVGVHPTAETPDEPTVEQLVLLSQHEKNVAIGETGLDYFRSSGDLSGQRARFATHLEAAKVVHKPLIIHTRMARADTLAMLKSHQADQVGGVLHCFTEDWATAKAGLDLGFYITFSGIVTFPNAGALRKVVKQMPMERILIETDSPYLAPVPYRGQPNEPKYVGKIAQMVAEIKDIDVETVAAQTSENFFNLFPKKT